MQTPLAPRSHFGGQMGPGRDKIAKFSNRGPISFLLVLTLLIVNFPALIDALVIPPQDGIAPFDLYILHREHHTLDYFVGLSSSESDLTCEISAPRLRFLFAVARGRTESPQISTQV